MSGQPGPEATPKPFARSVDSPGLAALDHPLSGKPERGDFDLQVCSVSRGLLRYCLFAGINDPLWSVAVLRPQ